jgi:glycosyltransferase involved in cell wall biosynthesis
MDQPEYVIVTPARNERVVLPDLVRSLDALEPRPALWLVVDDGSTDGSKEWLDAQAKTRPWMIVRDSPEPADEYLGGHVARLKRWGIEQALEEAARRDRPARYAGILDADILVPSDHYATLMRAMEREPKLGVTSSVIVDPGVETTRPDRFQRSDEPRGGTQFFRVRCLDDIGGLPPWPGFDGAANAKARARGWTTSLVTEVLAVQQREMAARFGVAQGYERRGKYAWFLGVHPVLVGLRVAAYSTTVAPGAGAAFARGWLGQALRGAPRCPDPDVRRAYGWQRLGEVASSLLGRGRAYVARQI